MNVRLLAKIILGSVMIGFLLSFITFCGCSSQPGKKDGETIPRYARRIQIVHYDSIVRTPSSQLQVFNEGQAIGRPYHIIAMLCHEAKPADQAMMMNAIAWNARQLGADGMIVLQPVFSRSRVNVNVMVGQPGPWWLLANSGDEQPLFGADAIVFDLPPTHQQP